MVTGGGDVLLGHSSQVYVIFDFIRWLTVVSNRPYVEKGKNRCDKGLKADLKPGISFSCSGMSF